MGMRSLTGDEVEMALSQQFSDQQENQPFTAVWNEESFDAQPVDCATQNQLRRLYPLGHLADRIYALCSGGGGGGGGGGGTGGGAAVPQVRFAVHFS